MTKRPLPLSLNSEGEITSTGTKLVYSVFIMLGLFLRIYAGAVAASLHIIAQQYYLNALDQGLLGSLVYLGACVFLCLFIACFNQ